MNDPALVTIDGVQYKLERESFEGTIPILSEFEPTSDSGIYIKTSGTWKRQYKFSVHLYNNNSTNGALTARGVLFTSLGKIAPINFITIEGDSFSVKAVDSIAFRPLFDVPEGYGYEYVVDLTLQEV